MSSASSAMNRLSSTTSDVTSSRSSEILSMTFSASTGAEAGAAVT